jgi:LDH2 family malate/lactate/ureidoglycolate dehydrogenase
MNAVVLVDAQTLHTFAARAFERVGVAAEDARIAADVLVAADLRGVESHGVARLHHYLAHLKQGQVTTDLRFNIVRECPTTLAIDAGNGLGMVAAYRAMQTTIERAAQYGSAAVAVRNSNHFGIAGYYAMMALPHDMIGIAMCNASPNVVPFGGSRAMLGTNPIAWAIPCGQEPAIVMDMATSGISYGKIEVALRTGATIPLGWALGEDGLPTADAREASRARRILPLGGFTEGTGYKGYALSTVVESLCHALAGASMSMQIMAVQGRGTRPSNIGHFFAAYRVDGFRALDEFKQDMDALVRTLRSCPTQTGVAEVLLPGEKEFRTAAERSREGIPLHAEVVTLLRSIATDLQLDPAV